MAFYINPSMLSNQASDQALFTYSNFIMQLLNTQNQSSSNQSTFNSSINSAGSAISQIFQNDTSGFEQGMNNANQGISLVQDTTSGLEQILNVLQQMSSLATEGASGLYSSTQLGNFQTQFSALQTEVNNIANTTTFNGTSLLENSSGSITIQVSNAPTATVTVNLPKTDTTTLGIASSDVNTTSDSTNAMTLLTNAMNTVSSQIAQLGGTQSILQNASIQDMDMISNLTNENLLITSNNFALTNAQSLFNMILGQADVMMQAQANATSELALQLLSGTNRS